MSADLATSLAQFTGSETATPHGLNPRIRMTEGVLFLAETAGAHWLTDVIVSHQLTRRVAAETFQVWKLTVADNRGLVTMTDGNSDKPIASQRIAFTDFPLAEITLYLSSGVLLLPSEY